MLYLTCIYFLRGGPRLSKARRGGALLGLTWLHVGTKLHSWPLLVASWMHFASLTAFVVALGRLKDDFFAFRRAPGSIFDRPGTLLGAINRHFYVRQHTNELACSTW